MNQIASKGQLRMSLLRWILFVVPITVLLGFAFSQFANSGEENRWFQALTKPDAQPPGPVFGAAWALLYVMMGTAFAMVLHARGAPLRGPAIILYLVQYALNLFWPVLFLACIRSVRPSGCWSSFSCWPWLQPWSLAVSARPQRG